MFFVSLTKVKTRHSFENKVKTLPDTSEFTILTKWEISVRANLLKKKKKLANKTINMSKNGKQVVNKP